MFNEWLKKGLSQKGKTARELADLLGYAESTVSRMAAGKRKIYADELEIISSYICMEPPFEYNPNEADRDLNGFVNKGVPIVGEINHTHWVEEIKPLEGQTIPMSRLPQFAGMKQVGFTLRHDAKDMKEGLSLNTVDFHENRATPLPGDYIVIKVKRSGFLQVRLIYVQQSGRSISLIDAYNGEEYTDKSTEEFEFLGLVIGAYMNFY